MCRGDFYYIDNAEFTEQKGYLSKQSVPEPELIDKYHWERKILRERIISTSPFLRSSWEVQNFSGREDALARGSATPMPSGDGVGGDGNVNLAI